MKESGPKKIGGFEVESELGQGGMGIVLLGRQVSLGRPAVLKKLHRDLADSAEINERFEREARTAAALHHPNVVAVYDRFSWRGHTYIAQEYVEGLDLRTALERVPHIPARIAALITLEVARGLEAIHFHGTVHRDLKPANILLGRNGEVKIADFGIALERSGSALTKPGIAIGTPAYMSPEQMRGERVDERGDLFSLAVVLYEMLSGNLPYAGSSDADTEALLSRVEREHYEPLRKIARRTPRYLSRIVGTCLHARACQRFETARVLRRLLERNLGCRSPADVASEIAEWLSEAGLIERSPDQTEIRPYQQRPPGVLSRAAALGAVAFVLGSVLWIGEQQTGASIEPAEPAIDEMSNNSLSSLEPEVPVDLAPKLETQEVSEASRKSF